MAKMVNIMCFLPHTPKNVIWTFIQDEPDQVLSFKSYLERASCDSTRNSEYLRSLKGHINAQAFRSKVIKAKAHTKLA